MSQTELHAEVNPTYCMRNRDTSDTEMWVSLKMLAGCRGGQYRPVLTVELNSWHLQHISRRHKETYLFGHEVGGQNFLRNYKTAPQNYKNHKRCKNLKPHNNKWSLIDAQLSTDISTALQSTGSLPYSQQPASYPCPEQDESISHPHIRSFFNVIFNIIYPSTPRSSEWSFSLNFPHQKPVCIYLLSKRATFPAHINLNNARWRRQILKLLTVYFSPFYCYFLPPRPE
jgi:hypothetical protein